MAETNPIELEVAELVRSAIPQIQEEDMTGLLADANFKRAVLWVRDARLSQPMTDMCVRCLAAPENRASLGNVYSDTPSGYVVMTKMLANLEAAFWMFALASVYPLKLSRERRVCYNTAMKIATEEINTTNATKLAANWVNICWTFMIKWKIWGIENPTPGVMRIIKRGFHLAETAIRYYSSVTNTTKGSDIVGYIREMFTSPEFVFPHIQTLEMLEGYSTNSGMNSEEAGFTQQIVKYVLWNVLQTGMYSARLMRSKVYIMPSKDIADNQLNTTADVFKTINPILREYVGSGNNVTHYIMYHSEKNKSTISEARESIPNYRMIDDAVIAGNTRILDLLTVRPTYVLFLLNGYINDESLNEADKISRINNLENVLNKHTIDYIRSLSLSLSPNACVLKPLPPIIPTDPDSPLYTSISKDLAGACRALMAPGNSFKQFTSTFNEVQKAIYMPLINAKGDNNDQEGYDLVMRGSSSLPVVAETTDLEEEDVELPVTPSGPVLPMLSKESSSSTEAVEPPPTVPVPEQILAVVLNKEQAEAVGAVTGQPVPPANVTIEQKDGSTEPALAIVVKDEKEAEKIQEAVDAAVEVVKQEEVAQAPAPVSLLLTKEETEAVAAVTGQTPPPPNAEIVGMDGSKTPVLEIKAESAKEAEEIKKSVEDAVELVKTEEPYVPSSLSSTNILVTPEQLQDIVDPSVVDVSKLVPNAVLKTSDNPPQAMFDIAVETPEEAKAVEEAIVENEKEKEETADADAPKNISEDGNKQEKEMEISGTTDTPLGSPESTTPDIMKPDISSSFVQPPQPETPTRILETPAAKPKETPVIAVSDNPDVPPKQVITPESPLLSFDRTPSYKDPEVTTPIIDEPEPKPKITPQTTTTTNDTAATTTVPVVTEPTLDPQVEELSQKLSACLSEKETLKREFSGAMATGGMPQYIIRDMGYDDFDMNDLPIILKKSFGYLSLFVRHAVQSDTLCTKYGRPVQHIADDRSAMDINWSTTPIVFPSPAYAALEDEAVIKYIYAGYEYHEFPGTLSAGKSLGLTKDKTEGMVRISSEGIDLFGSRFIALTELGNSTAMIGSGSVFPYWALFAHYANVTQNSGNTVRYERDITNGSYIRTDGMKTDNYDKLYFTSVPALTNTMEAILTIYAFIKRLQLLDNNKYQKLLNASGKQQRPQLLIFVDLLDAIIRKETSTLKTAEEVYNWDNLHAITSDDKLTVFYYAIMEMVHLFDRIVFT